MSRTSDPLAAPDNPLSLTPAEFENWVSAWLRASSNRPLKLAVRKKRSGHAGNYEIDVVVEFEEFSGAEFVILVECKRHADRVKRDAVMALKAKKDEIGAHKAMLFSTGGFQSGALDYARSHGIATVLVRDGASSYETKGLAPPARVPESVPDVVGWLVTPSDKPRSTQFWRISVEDPSAIADWLVRIGAIVEA